MKKSLYTKLVLIMVTVIISLMAVVGALLMRGVSSFYLNGFYDQMQLVFSTTEIAGSLRSAASGSDSASQMAEIIKAYSGQLGIDSGTRNFYILSGDTGEYITGSSKPENGVPITANITTAIAGAEGYLSDGGADYMDVALPIEGQSGSYIVYIIDNKGNVEELRGELFRIIIDAIGVGVIIAVGLSLLLSKTLVTPIQELTVAAEAVAGGQFSHKVENDSNDEIGVLTRTFNDMAVKLEDTLDDLKKSERNRREFVANVSHELRTPITSIRSYTETLEEDPDMDPETRARFLQVIVNESDRMTNIVQDLLTLSRFDAGSIEFSFEEFSFEKSVRDVYAATRMDAMRHHHEFSLEFKPPIPQIRGDSARIEQVLINMVSNAIKYTPDGGKIVMTAGAKGKNVWCTVKDNGIGIPKEEAERVFDRFYRVDKARSRESGGTGLGLSIAREIARRHGGDITVKSSINHGASFTLTLPAEGPENA